MEKEKEIFEKEKEDSLAAAKERENVLQEKLAENRLETTQKGN